MIVYKLNLPHKCNDRDSVVAVGKPPAVAGVKFQLQGNANNIVTWTFNNRLEGCSISDTFIIF